MVEGDAVEPDLDELTGVLGYRFRNRQLLQTAATDRTYDPARRPPVEHNQGLAFLGDAVIGMVAARILLDGSPRAEKGALTDARRNWVTDHILGSAGDLLGLDKFLFLGKNGRENLAGPGRETILAGFVEAICGAVFLDTDFAAAEDVFRRVFLPQIELARAKDSR